MSDQQIRRYFLGALPEGEAEAFEIECAASAELTARLQMVERELADDYLAGELSEADARLFETNYLITPARLARLRVAEGLRRIAAENAAEDAAPAVAAPARSFWRSLFGARLTLAAAACLLLLLAVCALFFFKRGPIDRDAVARVAEPAPQPVAPAANAAEKSPAAPETAPKPAANAAADRDGSPAPPPQVSAAPKPAAPAPAVAAPVLIVRLLPGSVRGEAEQSVRLAPGTKRVTLLLGPTPEAGRYRRFQAVVRTPEDGPVYTSPELKRPRFTMPADKLENRTYIVSLEGRNAADEFESIADYTMRVRR